MISYLDLLAQLPDEAHTFINPVKLAALTVGFTLWAMLVAWVDKDTIVVNTFRILWNMVVFSTGVVGIVVALFVPAFHIGFPILLVLLLAVLIIYVVHRNGLVGEDDTVLTPNHFRRLKEQGFSGKKKQKEVKERVRLTGADRKVVQIPEEDEEREQYRLTQDLMFDALWRRAARVDLISAGEAMKITYEVDGVKDEREALPRPEGEATLQYIKQIAGLSLDERRKPQKGRIMAGVGDRKINVVVQSGGSTAGERLTVRFLGPEEQYKVPDLGFNPGQMESVQAAREALSGLILISAPSGAGLTTTVYSMVRTHDRFLQNIQMLEYEKELPVDNVTQRIFDPAEGKSFAEQLQRLVRSDPDVVVLPELRDREAAVVAAQAAATKQKVYVALKANDVFEALRKWVEMVGDKKLAARGMVAICNQRLVRLLCNECKEAYKPDPQMMRKLNLPPDKLLHRPPEPEYDKRGNPIVCQACQGTGFVGRTAVFDWLLVDDGLRQVIQEASSMNEIQNYAVKRLGVGLQAQALQKVLDGQTSIQEVVRAVRSANSTPKGARTPEKPATPKPQPRTTDAAGPEEGR